MRVNNNIIIISIFLLSVIKYISTKRHSQGNKKESMQASMKKKALSPAERKRRSREKKKASQSVSKPSMKKKALTPAERMRRY